MNILHIDSSVLGTASASREISAAAMRVIRKAAPDAKVTYRDFSTNAPAHLNPTIVASLRPQAGAQPGDDPDADEQIRLTETLITEFLAADLVVIGAPMYNFSIPSSLKAWIDRIAQSGRTFRYTAQGPVGLAGDKKVIIISSRGSALTGTPYEAALDHQEAYLKTVMGFFGIKDVTVIRAEGLALSPDSRQAAITRALQESESLHQMFA